MTTSRKKKPASKTSSPKKGSSSRIKKPKLLPPGEYTCTVDSLIGTKLTLNVNDLTLKDAVKLGLRLNIEPKPTLHPVGDFVGTVVSFGEPRESRTKEHVYFMPVGVQTEHGTVFAALGVFLTSMAFIKAMQPYMIGENVMIRVRHDVYQGKMASASWI